MNTIPPARRDGAWTDERSIASALSQAGPGETEEFWRSVAESGTPLRGRDPRSATFVWRGPHARDRSDGSTAVHLTMNRVTDKHRYENGYMRHVPGTDIWVRTLDLDPDLSVSYGFTPLGPGESPRPGPPRFDAYDRFLDPFNPTPPLVRSGDKGLSLLHGPQASPQPEWCDHSRRPLAGQVRREARRLTARDGDRTRPHWLYLPPSGPTTGRSGPLPLLTIFDAETWFGRLDLPRALEAAVQTGRLPPLAVLGIANESTADRIASLGANSDFLGSVVGSSVPWAVSSIVAAGFVPPGRAERVIAGQSLGGLSALVCALEFPRACAHVLSHSPSMWWTPDGTSKPKDLGSVPEEDWIVRRFSEGAVHDVSVSLAVGSLEGPSISHVHALDRVVRQRGWAASSRMYPGGHDFAWWREALFDGLEAALGEAR